MMELYFDKQIEILRKVENPYIIKYLDHFSEETQFGDVHSILTNYYQVVDYIKIKTNFIFKLICFA